MGSIFSRLMKQGVATPDGAPTQYYDNPGQAIALASSKTAQPNTSSINGPNGGAPQIPLPTITSTQVGDTPPGGMGPMQSPNLSVTPGQDNTTVGMQDAPIGTQPRLVKPSFAEANATGGPLSDKLTSKGKILSFLIDAAQGAAAGDAAARTGDPRHGYAGLGSAAEAGFNVPIQNAQRRNALEQQQLEMQKTQAQTAAIPGHAAAELAEMQARTGNLNAQANRRENYTVPGVGLVSPDASQPNGYRVVVLNRPKEQTWATLTRVTRGCSNETQTTRFGLLANKPRSKRLDSSRKMRLKRTPPNGHFAWTRKTRTRQ